MFVASLNLKRKGAKMTKINQDDPEILPGKLVIVGFEGLELDRHLKRMIREYKVGGVILFRRNVTDADQVRRLTEEINEVARSAGYDSPPLIAVDQEGGMVNRITDGVALSPGNMAIGATRNETVAREVGEIIGKELKSLGINMNLAPVLDLVRDPENHLGTRCFAEDPELIGSLGREYSRGLAEYDVVPVGKHFLGYGGSTIDPHEELPRNELSREKLEPAVKPFRMASDSLGAVMSAHIILEEIDELPATLSKNVITGILRDEVNFNGPVVTDCLEMGAIQNKFGTEKGAVRAIEAGADLLIVSHREEEQVKAIQSIDKAVKNSRISLKRIAKSTNRIRNLTENWPDSGQSEYSLERDHERMVELAGRSITAVKNEGVPLTGDEEVLLVSPELSGRSLSRVQDKEHRTLSILNNLADAGVQAKEIFYGKETQLNHVLGEAKNSDKVVLIALEPRGLVKSLVYRLEDSQVKVVLAVVDGPWGFSQLPVEGLLFTYGHSPASMEALAQVLGGKLVPQGRVPVKLEGI